MARKNKGVAWYDIPGSGWLRDLWVLMHWPYSCWHLSYVVIGAALAPELDWGLLGWTVLAFFLAMGIGAHCFDEMAGRPLQTRISNFILLTVGCMSVGGALSIGIVVGVDHTIWMIPAMFIGAFLVFAYNFELFNGLFHTDEWFAWSWGMFPVLVAYLAQAHTIQPGVLGVALACFFYSLAQRRLSTQVRYWRRRVRHFEGTWTEDTPAGSFGILAPIHQDLDRLGHEMQRLTKDHIIQTPEAALQLMTWAVIFAAAGLLLLKF